MIKKYQILLHPNRTPRWNIPMMTIIYKNFIRAIYKISDFKSGK